MAPAHRTRQRLTEAVILINNSMFLSQPHHAKLLEI